MQHIFVDSKVYTTWRTEAGNTPENTIGERLKNQDMGDEQITNILTKAKCFFKDGKELWPLGDFQYYLGHVLNLRRLIPQNGKSNESGSRETNSWDIFRLAQRPNNASIRLASRIFGDLQRKVAKHWDERGGEDRRR